MITNRKSLRYGQTTDVGAQREENQDAAWCCVSNPNTSEPVPALGVFVVSDGMGGHEDGDRASAAAAKVFVTQVMQQIFTPLLAGDADDRPPITEALVAAAEAANRQVGRAAPKGGATLTAAVVLQDLAYIAHAGDSRAYLITPDKIEQLTRDHSFVQRLIEINQLKPEEAEDHPQRSTLYKGMGLAESVEVDTVIRRLPAGSRLLLCSDGLWNMVADDAIHTVVMDMATPQAACNVLVEMANNNGGEDNITAVIVQVDG